MVGNSIKEQMMPQAAILSEQVFVRTGKVSVFAYVIYLQMFCNEIATGYEIIDFLVQQDLVQIVRKAKLINF